MMEDNRRCRCRCHQRRKRRRRSSSSLFIYSSLLFLSNRIFQAESFVRTQQKPLQFPTVLSVHQDAHSTDNKRLQARSIQPRSINLNKNMSSRQQDNRSSSYKKKHHRKKKTPISVVKFNKMITRILSDAQRSSVEKAERLLLKRIEAKKSTLTSPPTLPTGSADYDTFSFNLILSAWARQRSPEAAQRADALLQTLLTLKTSRFANIQADAYSYSSVLNAYAKSGGNRQAALRAEELMSQMENTMKITTDICFNSVMECWSLSGDQDAGRRAQVWLTRLEENAALPNPTRISYNICLKAWARSENGAYQAHQLLDRMNTQSDARLRPDKISYSTCIDAYSRSKTNLTLAAEKAEALLHQMEKNPRIRPDVVAYTSLLSIFAKAEVDTKKALALVGRMKRHSREEPNTAFLNTLIHLFAKKGKAAHAESILDSMTRNGLADKISYTSAICAHANVGNSTRATELFNELSSMYEAERSNRYLPTEKTFTALIHALAKSKDCAGTSVEDVNRIVARMNLLYDETKSPALLPSTVTYSTIFFLLSKMRDRSVPVRAMELLNEMKDEKRNGNRNVTPDATTYAYIINIFTKARVPESAEMAAKLLYEVEEGYASGDDALRPTQLLYSAVLQAYAKSASKHGVEQAEKLLQSTEDLFKQGKMFAKPTALYYNAVIDGLARSRQGEPGAFRAEELLDEMENRSKAGDEELRPTARSYNAAILAWKTSNSSLAPQRAEALLKRMNDRYEAGDADCRPDQVTFNTIISLLANSAVPGAAERAEAYLKFMENMYYNAHDMSLKPDSISYNSVMHAYASCDQKDSAKRAEEIFDRMKMRYTSGDQSLSPTFATLTSLVRAWEKRGDPDAKMKAKMVSRLIVEQEEMETSVVTGVFQTLPNRTMPVQ